MSRRAIVSGCLLAAILWMILALVFAAGIAVGRATAASRSAQTTEAVDVSGPSSAALTRVPHSRGEDFGLPDASTGPATSPAAFPGGAPSPAGRGTPDGLRPIDPASAPAPSLGTLSDVVAEGIASTYGPGWDGWIAWPKGPGYRLHVCGPAACRDVTSNDAGPDLAMQRARRVIDLDVRTFERVCGVSWRMGLCPVVVTVLRVPR